MKVRKPWEELQSLPVVRPDDRSTTRFEPYVMMSEKLRDELVTELKPKRKKK